MSAAEGQNIAKMTVCSLQSVRSDENFELFWTKVTEMASNSEVDDPVLPRQRKRSRRYDDGTSEEEFPELLKIFIDQSILKLWSLLFVV